MNAQITREEREHIDALVQAEILGARPFLGAWSNSVAQCWRDRIFAAQTTSRPTYRADMIADANRYCGN